MTKFTKKDFIPYIKLYMLVGINTPVRFSQYPSLYPMYMEAHRNKLDWNVIIKHGYANTIEHDTVLPYFQFTEKFFEDIIEGKYFDGL